MMSRGLFAQIVPYLKHDTNCMAAALDAPCRCGMDKALSALQLLTALALPAAASASEGSLVAECATCGHARAYHARRVGPCHGGGDWCPCREFVPVPSPGTAAPKGEG